LKGSDTQQDRWPCERVPVELFIMSIVAFPLDSILKRKFQSVRGVSDRSGDSLISVVLHIIKPRGYIYICINGGGMVIIVDPSFATK
jgi:hypothetical protein